MLPEAFNNRADANNGLQARQFVFSVANALVTDLLLLLFLIEQKQKT